MKNDQKFPPGLNDAARKRAVAWEEEGSRRVVCERVRVVSAIDCPSPLLPAARTRKGRK